MGPRLAVLVPVMTDDGSFVGNQKLGELGLSKDGVDTRKS